MTRLALLLVVGDGVSADGTGPSSGALFACVGGLPNSVVPLTRRARVGVPLVGSDFT